MLVSHAGDHAGQWHCANCLVSSEPPTRDRALGSLSLSHDLVALLHEQWRHQVVAGIVAATQPAGAQHGSRGRQRLAPGPLELFNAQRDNAGGCFHSLFAAKSVDGSVAEGVPWRGCWQGQRDRHEQW